MQCRVWMRDEGGRGAGGSVCVSRRGTSDERKIIRASCVPLSLVPSAPDRGTQDSGIDMITMINTRIHWNRKIPERICCRRREKEGKGTQREGKGGRGKDLSDSLVCCTLFMRLVLSPIVSLHHCCYPFAAASSLFLLLLSHERWIRFPSTRMRFL